MQLSDFSEPSFFVLTPRGETTEFRTQNNSSESPRRACDIIMEIYSII